MEQKAGLNPFEIRAGLKQGSPSWLWPIIGLNPFEIRAGLKLFARLPDGRTIESLNPFEIRAGLKRPAQRGSARRRRLNPFEIRAGLKRLMCSGFTSVARS